MTTMILKVRIFIPEWKSNRIIENSSDYDEDESNCGDRIESMMPNDDDMMDIMQTANDDIGNDEDITAAPDFNTYDNDII